MVRVVIGVALIAGAIALWLGMRGSDPPPAKDMRSMDSGAEIPSETPAPPQPTAPIAPAPTVREAPHLTVYLDAGDQPAMSIDQQFAGQQRDGAWAGPTEKELGKRIGALREIHLDAAECRESLCKIVIAGTQSAIATAIDDLQSDKRGLRNWATRWTLSTPEMRGDALALTAYVRFDRPQPDQGED